MENIWLGRKLLVSRWREFLSASRRSQEFFFTFFSFTAKTENQWEINFLFTFSVSSIMSAPRIPLRFYFCLIQETSTLLTILSELFSDFFLKCSHVKIGESKKLFSRIFLKKLFTSQPEISRSILPPRRLDDSKVLPFLEFVLLFLFSCLAEGCRTKHKMIFFLFFLLISPTFEKESREQNCFLPFFFSSGFFPPLYSQQKEGEKRRRKRRVGGNGENIKKRCELAERNPFPTITQEAFCLGYSPLPLLGVDGERRCGV